MTDKFGMGHLGLGPLPGVAETMEFVRRAWSSFNLPQSIAPTIDLEEIDKRIADLRTVEQWLSLNLGMLQSAIQGLEIQRGTIAALKSFGEAVGSGGSFDAGANAAKAMAAMAAMAQAGTTAAPAASAAPAAASTPSPSPAPTAPQASAAPSDTESRAAGGTASASPPADPPATDAGSAGLGGINPASWWNLLQSQFTQVAQAAMAGSPLAHATDAASDATSRNTSKTGSGTTGRGKRKVAASHVTEPAPTARKSASRKPAASRTPKTDGAPSGRRGRARKPSG